MPFDDITNLTNIGALWQPGDPPPPDPEEPDDFAESGTRPDNRTTDIERDRVRRQSEQVRARADARTADLEIGFVTADVLMRKHFPDPRWSVPGIFPEGLSVIAGPPKIGKSWLVLAIAVAVASGGRALGKIAVDRGDVLYCALEDTLRRLQERVGMLLGDASAPVSLAFTTDMPDLQSGFEDRVRKWLDEHPDARMVIVDTLAKVRGGVPGLANLYSLDYGAVGRLKAIADDYGIALLVVHHTRKAVADDPLDTVSGTNGLTGAADTICVLRREIGRSDATLYVRGRDVPEADHALQFDPASCSWTLLGDAEEYRRSEERQAIISLLGAASEPLSPKAIAEALGKRPGAVRYLLHKLAREGAIVGIGGAYHLPNPLTTTNTTNTTNGESDPVSTVSGVSGEHRDRQVPIPLIQPERNANALPPTGTDDRRWIDV